MSELTHERQYINRFSILLATLAVFLGAQFVVLTESREPGSNLFGFMFSFNVTELVPLMLGLLCAAGCFWLFATHPDRAAFAGRPWVLLPNVVLPALAALIASSVLIQLERNLLWWVGLGFGLGIIGVIIHSEYQVLSPENEAYRLVAPLLISLAFGLFLAFNISMAASQLRMYAQFLLVLIAAMFVSFRTIHLRSQGMIRLNDVLICCLLDAEVAGALYYLFLKPVQVGLIISGCLYVLTALITIDEKITRRRLTEVVLMTAVVGILLAVVSFY